MVHLYNGTVYSHLKGGGSLYTDITYLHDNVFGEESKAQKSLYDMLPVFKRGEDETGCSSFPTCAQRTPEGCRKDG